MEAAYRCAGLEPQLRGSCKQGLTAGQRDAREVERGGRWADGASHDGSGGVGGGVGGADGVGGVGGVGGTGGGVGGVDSGFGGVGGIFAGFQSVVDEGAQDALCVGLRGGEDKGGEAE